MEILFNSPGKAGAATTRQGAAGDLVKDGNAASFMADVIEASMTVPVIVDFWATWCGPCKTLGPMLEKLVREAKGAVRMVKIDIDKNPEIAGQLRIQSVPTVYAFKGGRPVDGFTGALPESQLKQFIKRLTGSEPGADLDEALAEAKTFLDQGDSETALAIYQEVLAQDPAHAAAIGGVLKVYLKLGETEAAKQMLADLPPEVAKHPDVAAVRTTLELAEQAGAGNSEQAELRRRVATAPDDHQARFDLALAYFAAGEREAAVDELLEIVRRDRTWNDDGARKQLVKLFEAFGPTDPLTVASRKRLSSLLFA